MIELDFLRPSATGDGKGIRIAVLDSGIDAGHPGLDGLRLTDDVAYDETGIFLREQPGIGDDAGHGTAIAGIIHRIAPAAEIGSFRVLGSSLQSRSAIIAAGAIAAIRRGYHILNCSFGCRGNARFLVETKRWVDAAYLSGAHIVAACSNADAGIEEWPSHFPSVLATTMHDLPEGIFRRLGSLVEFAAPGHRISVPWHGRRWAEVSGTSFAAAHLSGALACLLSAAEPRPSIMAIKSRLLDENDRERCH